MLDIKICFPYSFFVVRLSLQLCGTVTAAEVQHQNKCNFHTAGKASALYMLATIL